MAFGRVQTEFPRALRTRVHGRVVYFLRAKGKNGTMDFSKKKKKPSTTRYNTKLNSNDKNIVIVGKVK